MILARELLIGFDSVWADNPRKPGAIAAMIREDGRIMAFYKPRLARFAEAAALAKAWGAQADYMLIGIDQPTLVPNETGSRPVDRVAASLVSRLRSGVQPARRGGMGAPMFGDDAPIWRFLADINAIQNPVKARGAVVGRYAMEVFPALALPAMVPELWRRRMAAKYNPAVSKFVAADWTMVAAGMARFARGLGAAELAMWLAAQADHPRPRKADQDCLDAAICLAIVMAWRHGPAQRTLLIGDARHGHMATIVSAETRAILAAAAARQGVPTVSLDALDQHRDPLSLADAHGGDRALLP